MRNYSALHLDIKHYCNRLKYFIMTNEITILFKPQDNMYALRLTFTLLCYFIFTSDRI